MNQKIIFLSRIFRSRTFKGIMLAMTATVSWASLCIVGRYLFGTESGHCNAFVISFFRNFFGAVAMLLFTASRRKLPQLGTALRRDGKTLALLTLVVVGEGFLQIASLKYTTAARSSLFANTAPIYTLLIAHFALKEPLNRKNLSGMTAGMLGVIIVGCTEGTDLFASGRMFTGDLLALCSGICWAVFTVFGANAVKRSGSLLSGTAITLLAALIQIPFVIWLLPGSLPMPWSVVAGILYMGIFTVGVANICWMAALKYLSAGATGAFGYISVALTLIFSVVFLNEKLTVPVLIAIVLIIGGVEQMLAGSRK